MDRELNHAPAAKSHCPPDTNLVDRLRYWSATRPDQVAFYSWNGGDDEKRLTYRELDRQSREIAVRLRRLGAVQKPVLLLYPQSLEFVSAFFGCLYAGAIAVPAFPPRRNRNIERIQSISEDAGADVVLTVRDVIGRSQDSLEETPQLRQLNWLSTDDFDSSLADEWRMPELDAAALARTKEKRYVNPLEQESLVNIVEGRP